MQFSKDRKKKLYTKLSGDRRAELYTHSLQFYQEPPSENISLAEFETFAIERLKLLKSVENLGVSYVKTNDQYKAKLESELRKLKFPYRPVNEAIKDDEYDQRRKDHISHFILRLAYCQSEDLRRWFIQQEMDLFRYRFSVLTKGAIQEFLNHNKLKYDAISVEEKESYKEKLRLSTPGLSTTKIDEQEFYKVPFQDALDLVRPRKVFLRKGFAYIPHQEIITIVLNDFRTKLSKALALTARALPAVQSDERLQPLLNHLSHSYIGKDYTAQKNVGTISLEQLDSLSSTSFPLCMRQLHKALRDTHHLRHGGRMQYGLFLKGIGLTLDQALQFWKLEFMKGKVDAEKKFSYPLTWPYRDGEAFGMKLGDGVFRGTALNSFC